MEQKIIETRIGRVVGKRVERGGVVLGGTISVLVADDIKRYRPNFRGIIVSSGDVWEKKAGLSWVTPPANTLNELGWDEFGLIYWQSTIVVESEKEAMRIIVPKIHGTWLEKFRRKGGDVFAGSCEEHVRVIKDTQTCYGCVHNGQHIYGEGSPDECFNHDISCDKYESK